MPQKPTCLMSLGKMCLCVVSAGCVNMYQIKPGENDSRVSMEFLHVQEEVKTLNRNPGISTGGKHVNIHCCLGVYEMPNFERELLFQSVPDLRAYYFIKIISIKVGNCKSAGGLLMLPSRFFTRSDSIYELVVCHSFILHADHRGGHIGWP